MVIEFVFNVRALEERARVDLEQVRLQLEEAQRREADQLRMIQMLERENRQWKKKQRSIGNDIMANDGCMANINSIARCGSRPITAADNSATVLPVLLIVSDVIVSEYSLW